MMGHNQWSQRAVLAAASLTVGSLSWCVHAVAADFAPHYFDFTPRISVEESYVDRASGLSAGSSGLITSLEPGFSLRRKGSRLTADVNYSLNDRYYHRDRETDIRHQLSGSAVGTIVNDELFIDSAFGKRDQIISPLGVADLNSALQRGNLASTTNWSIGPRWERRYGRVASSRVQYQANRVSFGGKTAEDSWGTNVTGALESGAYFDRWFWSLNFSRDDVNYSKVLSDSSFQTAAAKAGYRFSRKFSAYYERGRENNSYQGSIGSSGGAFWNVGGTYTPSSRTSLDFSVGKRFFGDTYAFSFNHSARHWTVVASRSQTVTSIRQRQLSAPFLICPPEIPACTPEEALAFGVDFGLRNGTYVEKSLTGAVTYRLAKSAITLSAFDQQRQFRDGTNGNDKSSGATLGWNWRVGPRTSFDASTGWTQYKVSLSPIQQVDRWFFRTGLDRKFAPDLSGSLTYSYQRRSADGARSADAGSRNTISARVTKTF